MPPKTKTRNSIWPAISLLGSCPEELKSSYYRKECIPIFIGPQIITAESWKQTSYLSKVGGWKKCGIYRSWSSTLPKGRSVLSRLWGNAYTLTPSCWQAAPSKSGLAIKHYWVPGCSPLPLESHSRFLCSGTKKWKKQAKSDSQAYLRK